MSFLDNPDGQNGLVVGIIIGIILSLLFYLMFIYDSVKDKMTADEIAIYEVIEDNWNEWGDGIPSTPYTGLKKAILTRRDAPLGLPYAFADLSHAIFSIQSGTIDQWRKGESPDSKFNKTSFREVNPIWWIRIEGDALKEHPREIQRKITELAMTFDQARDSYKFAMARKAVNDKENAPPEKEIRVSENLDKVDVSKLLPYDQYAILQKEVEGCESAKQKLREIFRKNRFLTISDKEDIQREILYCKSVELEGSIK